jgi:lipoprotein-anchoring transpeptidase ErfK/SrfK
MEDEMGLQKSLVLIAMAILLGLLLVACDPSAPSVGPTVTPEPSATSGLTKAQRLAERWIEVLLDEQIVLLHDGDEIFGEYLVSTGVGTSPETTTYPGEFRIQTMWKGPDQTARGVFVENIAVFDWEHGNGFHSLPMDKDGNILDPTLGTPASAGCIRVGNSEEFYEFAETGMKVVIH